LADSTAESNLPCTKKGIRVDMGEAFVDSFHDIGNQILLEKKIPFSFLPAFYGFHDATLLQRLQA
jgi:hypothetical protein